MTEAHNPDTRGAMSTVLQCRKTHSSEVAGEIERHWAALDRLQSLQMALGRQG